MAIDWISVRSQYVNGHVSLRELAKQTGVSYSQIAKVAAKEKWADMRGEQRIKVESTANQIIADSMAQDIAQAAVDRAKTLLDLGDQLAAQIQRAITELDRKMVKSKTKVKKVTYDPHSFKPAVERVEEHEDIGVAEGIIDRQGLQQLTAALKNLRDVMMPLTENGQGEDESGVVILAPVKEDEESGVMM